MYKFVFLSLLFFSNACAFNYDAEIDKIVSSYLKYMRKTQGIYTLGSGGGALGEVSLVGVHLETCKRLNLEQARYLFVQSVEELLNRINQNKQIRPHLHNFPFSVGDELSFILGFIDKGNIEVPQQYIAFIKIQDRMVCYFTYDHTQKKYIDYFYEPYVEALKIFKKQKAINAIKN